MNNLPSEMTTSNASKKSGREGFLNYSIAEDLQLCESWLKISKNSVVETDQESVAFWENIRAHFSENLKESRCERTAKGLMNRWGRYIQKNVLKYCIYYEQVQNLRQSREEHELGEQSLAKDMYIRFERKPFLFEHCWEVLRADEKWKSRVKDFKDKQMAFKTNKDKNKEVSAGPLTVTLVDEGAESSSNANSLPAKQKTAEEQEALKRKINQALENELEFLIETKKKRKYLHQLVVEEQRKNDYNIMAMDLSKLDHISRQYFENEKRKILKKSFEEQEQQ
ncbi:hypothetical protein INT45_004345 [Circinella minor]|uniref:No apical meristem-associated C-terminal domain-containing protein n=1 Tax=Circinella minor TaxID=1195481 RepID=A0A8H7SDH9_9FUNG|nr:hypothetical protein INT45_004345 [Circinella minor]